MTARGLFDLIRDLQLDEALELALRHRTSWVREQLQDDVAISNAADQVSLFIKRWLAALPPLERLQAADWAVGQYVLGLVHLPDARGTGARLYLEAQRAAAAALATSMRQVEGFADGPDAGLHPSVPQRLYGYADQLDAVSFEFVPADPAD